ncbi:MAG: histidine--tRNA ligase [Spirochaetes bacterium]|nr:histidine--tRNA ligase [Spirochaetota bacterium]
MAELIEPRVLKGFRDFLPDIELERKRVQGILEATFERFGFVPIDTPVLEYTDILLGKGGGETDKQLYRFQDNGGRDVAMRFDLTVPFARFMAAHVQELYLPFKRYHIAKVFRGENTQRGRYREFTQCDFDIVGVDSPAADFEILLLMRESFYALGIDRVQIHLSHRGIFNRALQRLKVQDKGIEVLRTVDKIKKIGEEAVQTQLKQLVGTVAAEEILQFGKPESSFLATLEKITSIAGGPAEDTERLHSIYHWFQDLGIQDSFLLDPSITRGLDYYTGIVYETFLLDLPGIGSVCSGGRYNDLASLYTKERLPGVGSSIGLDRLLAALEELGKKPECTGVTEILVFCLEDRLFGDYHKIAQELRRAGFATEVFPEQRKLANQFSFAEKKKIPLGVFLGSEEKSRGVFSLRDLRTRVTYENLTLPGLTAKAKELLGKQ